MIRYFKNLRAYFKLIRQEGYGTIYLHKAQIQYTLLGFNYFTGRLILRANNYGLFYIIEKDIEYFN